MEAFSERMAKDDPVDPGVRVAEPVAVERIYRRVSDFQARPNFGSSGRREDPYIQPLDEVGDGLSRGYSVFPWLHVVDAKSVCEAEGADRDLADGKVEGPRVEE
jgi:hypothetical protein